MGPPKASVKHKDEKGDVELLIEKLSTNGTEQLDKNDTKKLKVYCKSLDTNQQDAMNYIGRLVLHQLAKDHAQIRYGSLLIIEYLFERSHHFRLFICDNLNPFFEQCFHVKGFKNQVKPEEMLEVNDSAEKKQSRKKVKTKTLLPLSWAKKLRQKAFDCFQYWHREFGSAYKILKNGHRFLHEKGITNQPTNDAAPSASHHSPQIEQSDDFIQRFELEKYEQEFGTVEDDANALITQIDTCFDLLIPKFKIIEDAQPHDSFHFRPMQGLSFSIILNSKVEIIRDSTNCDLIDNLKELCNELNKIYSGKLIQFSQSVSQLELPLYVERLKKLTENVKCLKMKAATIIWKFNEIKISTVMDISSSKPVIDENEDETTSDSCDDDFEDVPEREDLFLVGKVELEKQLQKQTHVKASISQEELPDLDEHRCRAPLPSGKLCPRRDMQNCPFHGKIVPRDKDGLPVDATLRERELEAKFQEKADEWKDPKYLRQLSIQTGRDLEGKSLKNKRKKYPNLVDIKKLTNTPRKRLMRKVCSTRVREKVADDLNRLDERAHAQYSDQWAYALGN